MRDGRMVVVAGEGGAGEYAVTWGRGVPGEGALEQCHGLVVAGVKLRIQPLLLRDT